MKAEEKDPKKFNLKFYHKYLPGISYFSWRTTKDYCTTSRHDGSFSK